MLKNLESRHRLFQGQPSLRPLLRSPHGEPSRRPDGLRVVSAWGFQYKTAFVWAKGRGPFGNYHTASAELLIVATHGSCLPEADKREDQVQTVPRPGGHSVKPEEFRAMIDRLYPTGPRVELFARGGVPEGWRGWGNEYD